MWWSVIASVRDSETGNPVDSDDHREGDQQHGDPEHRDGAEIARLLEVEDEHRDDLGLRGEQNDGGGELAHHADEDEAPGGDYAGAQQRRGDVAQRPQPGGAEDAAGVLEVGMDR